MAESWKNLKDTITFSPWIEINKPSVHDDNDDDEDDDDDDDDGRFALHTNISHFRLILITKTCLYNFDPLKPHFYIVKLGFTGVYVIFLIFAQNIDCGYSLEPPRRGCSNEYPQFMFWAGIWKISEFFIWKFLFFGGKIFSIYLIGLFS